MRGGTDRRLRTIVAVALALPLGLGGPLAASAEPASPVEEVGQPLRDVLLIGGDVGPGPGGETVIWSASSSTPAALNAVDPDTGAVVAAFPLEGAGGAWAVESTADGSVYVGTYGSSHLFRWTDAGGLVDLGNPIAGGSFVWALTSDDNGVVYGGMSPNGSVFSYDPATDQFRDYGRISDADYVRSIAYHDGTVYVGTSRPSRVFALDPASGEVQELPSPPGANPEAEYVYDLNAAGDHLYARFGEAGPNDLFVYDIPAGQWVDHIPLAHGLDVTDPDADGRVFLIAGGELSSYDPVTSTLEKTGMPFIGRVANTRGIGWAELSDPDFPGQSVVGLLWRGTMFRYSPTTGAFDFVESRIEGTAIPVTALAEGPEGTIHAGGFLSGGFATLDAETGEQQSFHRFAQMESLATLGDTVYLGAYPGARLYAYDPSLAWNSSEYSPATQSGVPENPAKIVDLTLDEQVRAGALTAAGEYVALGTEPGLDRLGGVFLLWDPASRSVIFQQRGLIEDQSIVSLTYRDGIVYGASSIHGGYSATEPRATEAVVFAWSVADQQKLWEVVPIPGAPTVEDLAFDAHGTLWGVAGGQAFALDVDAQEVWSHVSPPEDGRAQQLAFNATDGMLYVDWGAAGLGWIDPATSTASVLADHDAVALTTDSNGRVWFSEGASVYRFAVDAEEPGTTPGNGGTAAENTLPATGVTGLGASAVLALLLAVGGALLLRSRTRLRLWAPFVDNSRAPR